MTDQRQQHESPLDALPADLSPEEAERLREVWDLAADAEPAGEGTAVDTEAALDHLLTMVGAVEGDSSSPPLRESEQGRGRDPAPNRVPRPDSSLKQRSRGRSVPWVAAALALLVVGGVLAYWWQQPVTRTAPKGERVAFALPDGSEVQLNSGSTLRYDRSFGDMRAVSLDGEAFFEVVSDERPFLVRTHNANVRALGTAFNVQARPDAPSAGTQVTLVGGTVEVRPREGNAEAVRMQPGETRRLRGGSARLSAPLDVTVEEATAWRHGDLIVRDRSLEAVLPEVERRFAVELAVRPDSLAQQRISLALRTPRNAESVVEDIALVLGLEYRETANGFTLYER